jgi:hypothetical protein
MTLLDWKKRYHPLLVGLVLVAFCAAAWLVHTRYRVEKQNNTVEQLMDYQAILMMAQREGIPSQELLKQFRDAGVTTLAVYDTTLERLDREGALTAAPGADLRHAGPGSYGGAFDALLASGSVRPDAVYVARGKDDTAWRETVEDLRLRYGTDRVHPIAGREDLLEVLGDDRMLQVPDYRAKTPVMQAPLGLSTKELKAVHDAGFYAAVRPQNYLPVTEEKVRSLFRRIDESGAQVTTYVPAGTDVVGFPASISVVGDALAKRNIRFGLLEHVTQLQFTKFEGLDPLLRAVDYNAVRVYNIDALENSKLEMPDALRRWALADEERNIRVNYVRLFNKPQHGVDIVDLNLSYMRQITEQVKARGFQIGVATVLQNPYGPQVLQADGSLRRTGNGAAVFGGPYFPAKGSFLVVALGALAGLALYVNLVCRRFTLRWQLGFVGLGMVVTAAALFLGRGLLIRQVLALVGASVFPVLSISVILRLWENIKGSDTPTAAILGNALWQLAVAVAISLVGATLNAAIMGDNRFFLEADIYRGVKLTFVMPVLLTFILFLAENDIFHRGGNAVHVRPASLVGQVVEVCRTKLSLYHLVILGVLLFAAYIFVGRSGHTGGVPVPAIEIKLRTFLEQVMYARPREKEFMIGHPAFFLAAYAAYRKAPAWLRLFLVLGAVIGQGSLVQTFCHMRTPAIMSYVRALDGYALGAVLGIVAVILVSLLRRPVLQWMRRFSVHE